MDSLRTMSLIEIKGNENVFGAVPDDPWVIAARAWIWTWPSGRADYAPSPARCWRVVAKTNCTLFIDANYSVRKLLFLTARGAPTVSARGTGLDLPPDDGRGGGVAYLYKSG